MFSATVVTTLGRGGRWLPAPLDSEETGIRIFELKSAQSFDAQASIMQAPSSGRCKAGRTESRGPCTGVALRRGMEMCLASDVQCGLTPTSLRIIRAALAWCVLRARVRVECNVGASTTNDSCTHEPNNWDSKRTNTNTDIQNPQEENLLSP